MKWLQQLHCINTTQLLAVSVCLHFLSSISQGFVKLPLESSMLYPITAILAHSQLVVTKALKFFSVNKIATDKTRCTTPIYKIWWIPKHLFTMAIGGQRVMWCGCWPISRQHGDVMPSSFHGKKCHEIHYIMMNTFCCRQSVENPPLHCHGA